MNTKTKKIEVTEDNFGDLLIEGIEQALDHAQGKITLNSETLELPSDPPEYSKGKIKKLRKELNMSQSVFSLILNVSPKTVQSWELGMNTPSGSTKRLLQLLEQNPILILKILSWKK